MKKNNLIRLMLFAVILVAVAGAGYYFLLLPRFNSVNPVIKLADASFGWKFPVAKFPSTGSTMLAYSDIRDPGGIPQGLPVRLKIPVIGVDSAIEDALITKDGRMDVPAGSVDVAWFALGPHPGEEGSAVIGGHFGIKNGMPFVFYKLDQLKIGDKIYIEDDRGDTLAFAVRSISLFDRNADATTVFTSSDGLAHLNLITCEGVWNQVNGNYPERRVVFAYAIPSEGAAPTAVVAPIVRSLSVGMRGVDVTTLQTALEKIGFIKMPRGVAKGYFGALTRVAVVNYQKSVGLRANGVFGASTRDKLIPKQTVTAISPTLPATAIIAPISVVEPAPSVAVKTPPPFQSLMGSIKSLYATPVDGLITTVLLVLVLLVGIKILNR